MRLISPVFLVISGNIKDTNEILERIEAWLSDFLGPLIYEIRDTTNTLGGMTPDGSYPYLESLVRIEGYLLFFVVVLLCYFSYKFFRMFF